MNKVLNGIMYAWIVIMMVIGYFTPLYRATIHLINMIGIVLFRYLIRKIEKDLPADKRIKVIPAMVETILLLILAVAFSVSCFFLDEWFLGVIILLAVIPNLMQLVKKKEEDDTLS